MKSYISKALHPVHYAKTWVNINAFTRRFMPVLHEDVFIELQRALLAGHKDVQVANTDIERLEEALALRKEKNRKLALCAKRNNKGKEYEKEGKLALANRTYEKNIEGDCCPAMHSFSRLMVIYRKQKDYNNEIRVIERAIEVFGTNGDFEKRLEKAKQLKQKQYGK